MLSKPLPFWFCWFLSLSFSLYSFPFLSISLSFLFALCRLLWSGRDLFCFRFHCFVEEQWRFLSYNPDHVFPLIAKAYDKYTEILICLNPFSLHSYWNVKRNASIKYSWKIYRLFYVAARHLTDATIGNLVLKQRYENLTI